MAAATGTATIAAVGTATATEPARKAENTKATLASGLFFAAGRCRGSEGMSGALLGIPSRNRGLDGFSGQHGRLLRRLLGLAVGPTGRFLDEVDPSAGCARRPPPAIMRTHEQTPVHR
ncbi:hypothetical protein ADE_03030 [Achromobacter denitrificans]|nr:hypothetical protein ADE_03030 [Achromobacter denitrificans]